MRKRVEKRKKTAARVEKQTKMLGARGMARVKARKAQIGARHERELLQPPSEQDVHPASEITPPEMLGDGAQPPPPPPEPETASAPRGGGAGQWRVIKVPGGWLRWSAIEKRVDAHCVGHRGGEKCAMNRQVAAGACGLACFWFQRCHPQGTTRYDQEMMKESLSVSDARGARRAARAEFAARAVAEADVQELLNLEAELRGGDLDEPRAFTCHPLHKTLERLMRDPENYA